MRGGDFPGNQGSSPAPAGSGWGEGVCPLFLLIGFLLLLVLLLFCVLLVFLRLMLLNLGFILLASFVAHCSPPFGRTVK